MGHPVGRGRRQGRDPLTAGQQHFGPLVAGISVPRLEGHTEVGKASPIRRSCPRDLNRLAVLFRLLIARPVDVMVIVISPASSLLDRQLGNDRVHRGDARAAVRGDDGRHPP
jgi:hypothetical protein